VAVALFHCSRDDYRGHGHREARRGFPATREMHISISGGTRGYRIGMRNARADNARLAMTRMLRISAIAH